MATQRCRLAVRATLLLLLLLLSLLCFSTAKSTCSGAYCSAAAYEAELRGVGAISIMPLV
jgi:hypothetical protein